MEPIFRGGSYELTQGTNERGTESHHPICQHAISTVLAVFLKLKEGPEWERELKRFRLIFPGVEMLVGDHLRTRSHKDIDNSHWYREEQSSLLQSGRIDRIWGKELEVFAQEFPDGKYDRAIVQAERQLLLIEKDLVRLDERFRLDPDFKKKLEDRVKLQNEIEAKEKKLEEIDKEKALIVELEAEDLLEREEKRKAISDARTPEERASLRKEYIALNEKIQFNKSDLKELEAKQAALSGEIKDLETKRGQSLKEHVQEFTLKEKLEPALDKASLRTELKEIRRQAEINPWPYNPERLLTDPSIKTLKEWQKIDNDKVCFFGEREVVKGEKMQIEEYNWTILMPPGGMPFPGKGTIEGPRQCLMAAILQEDLVKQGYEPRQITFGSGRQETDRTLWVKPDTPITVSDLTKGQLKQLADMPPPIVAELDDARRVHLQKGRSEELEYIGYVPVSFGFTLRGQNYDDRSIWVKPEERLSFSLNDLNGRQYEVLTKSQGPFQLDYYPDRIVLLTPSLEGGLETARIEQLKKDGFIEVPFTFQLTSRPGETFERTVWTIPGQKIDLFAPTRAQYEKLVENEHPVVVIDIQAVEQHQRELQQQLQLQQQLEQRQQQQDLHRSRGLGL